MAGFCFTKGYLFVFGMPIIAFSVYYAVNCVRFLLYYWVK